MFNYEIIGIKIAFPTNGVLFQDPICFWRRDSMTFGKACKFYEDSKCLLQGKYCDLNCNHFFSDEDALFYDRVDTFSQWQREEVERKIRFPRSRLVE